MTSQIKRRIGFIGLGVMGEPIALNLVKAGESLIVWNRSTSSQDRLRIAGAEVARTVDEVFEKADTVIFMLVDKNALDAVLDRGGRMYGLVKDRIVISMSTVPPAYSQALAGEIEEAGGMYVEAPVSGSRKAAEMGELVVMLGGAAGAKDRATSILRSASRKVIDCGPAGAGLSTKLSVNLLVNTMLVSMAEATLFAKAIGIDLALYAEAIEAGPMSCPYAKTKLPKLIERNFSVQATASEALQVTNLITDEARRLEVPTPLLDLSCELYRKAVEMGHGREDMASVLLAVEAWDGNE